MALDFRNGQERNGNGEVFSKGLQPAAPQTSPLMTNVIERVRAKLDGKSGTDINVQAHFQVQKHTHGDGTFDIDRAEALVRGTDMNSNAIAIPVPTILEVARELPERERELTRLMIGEALHAIPQFRHYAQNSHFQVSVNVHPSIFDETFASDTIHAVRNADIGNGLVIEVTEEELLPDTNATLRTLDRLNSHGIPVLIDDALGKGSVYTLEAMRGMKKQMPLFSGIKFGKEFAKNENLPNAMREIASWKKAMTVEGVEDRSLDEKIGKIAADLIGESPYALSIHLQGWAISKAERLDLALHRPKELKGLPDPPAEALDKPLDRLMGRHRRPFGHLYTK
jgi:hypothetical protein